MKSKIFDDVLDVVVKSALYIGIIFMLVLAYKAAKFPGVQVVFLIMLIPYLLGRIHGWTSSEKLYKKLEEASKPDKNGEK